MMENIPKFVLEKNGFSDFNPVQKQVIEKGFEKNLVVSSPTASGKTIIIELFMLENVLNKEKKVIYTCPLKALASEHYTDFKKKYPEIKFALSTGDIDSSSSYLKKFDVIFTTFEKLASLLRHKAEWLNSVGCLVIDEIHEIGGNRGPTLEVALTQIRLLNNDLRLLGLSATISNSNEIAEWLNADLVKSDYRPTKLVEGIFFDNVIEYNNSELVETSFESLLKKELKSKQFLFFLNSRKRAEGEAKKIKKNLGHDLLDLKKLVLLSESILSVLEQPTEQCISLANCVKSGVAFHHAGLIDKQKKIVENAFRQGLIKIICSTTTLSAGLNLPADFVVIPSLYRFSGFGMDLIPVMEYKQSVGRSGRPKFSSEGRSIIFAGTENQKELFLEKYVNGSIEPIVSCLGQESMLRTIVLGLIAVNQIFDDKSTWSFFEKTLFVKQHGALASIYETVLEIIDDLVEMGFVVKKDKIFSCTIIGKRVSDLFLDPKSAYELVNALKNKNGEKSFSELSYLFAWTNCVEFGPKLIVPKKISKIIFEDFNSRISELPFSEEKLFFDNDSLNTFFSAMILEKWINECSENSLFEDFGLTPGTLFGKNKAIEWLAYSTIELSKVLGLIEHVEPAKAIGLRTKYGVRKELLKLVELRGIGRVRARKLFNAGITSPSLVKKNFLLTEQLIGKQVAEKLKPQLKIKD